MECTGPGVIDRLWFTYKGEISTEPYDLLIYLDDPDQAAIQMNLDELFTAGRAPFVEPLAGVPFRQSLRITWEHGHDAQAGPNLDPGRYSGLVFFYAPVRSPSPGGRGQVP
jgi:hypothetical protein